MAGNPQKKPDDTTSFWSELKRRNVVKVAMVYAVVGWLIIQIASATFSGFGIPPWAFRFVVMMVLLGFPISLIITWAFELTPAGIKTAKAARREQADQGQDTEMRSSRTWLAIGFAAAVPTLIFGALALFFFVQTRSSEPTPIVADEAATAPIEDVTLSIAMMPLINMSSNEENAYFAGGIHEDVLTNLSRIKDLLVVSRTTMLRYAASELTIPEIGAALDVDYIVEGSVRRIGNHVRVTVQLINARKDHHLWASNYERELVDVFATQSELSREISNAIHLEIQPESVGKLTGMPTTSVLAYDLYLKAISIEKTEDTTEENVLHSTMLLEQAVEADPDFVEAWALLKRRYDFFRNRSRWRAWGIEDGEDPDAALRRFKEKSDRALAKALALDPDNIETLLAQAVNHEGTKTPEFEARQREIYDSIITAHPDNADAWYHLGWWYWHLDPSDEENAIHAWEEALKRDPFNARYVRSLLERYRTLADQENVKRMAELLVQIVPEVGEDRQLARINQFQRMQNLESAFRVTADESLLAAWTRLWNDPETWDSWTLPIPVSIARAFTGIRLWAAIGEPNRIIETADNLAWPDSLPDRFQNNQLFFHLNAMKAHLVLGQKAEAVARARKIIEYHDQAIGPDQALLEPRELSILSRALGVVGEKSEAKAISDQLISGRSENFDPDGSAGFYSLISIDLDRAVNHALEEKKNNPDWDELDWIAANHLFYRDFVTHSRMKEYYRSEGKWVDFLAKSVPEYADTPGKH